MIYNELGKSGVRVSALSFGSMRWQSEEACHQIIHRGMDLGMNYIDTSTGYVGGQNLEIIEPMRRAKAALAEGA